MNSSKSLVVSIIVCAFISVFVLMYMSSYSSKTPELMSADGLTKKECVENGGQWGWTSKYSASKESSRQYYCYN